MANTTALVLGGGGYTAAAWEIGMLAGLADAGIDLTTAGTVIGTSAGAINGVRLLAGPTVGELYERELAGHREEIELGIGLGTTVRFLWAVLGSRNPRTSRKRIGRMALAARTITEAEALEAVDVLLPVSDWPGGRLRVAAVDSYSGELSLFGPDSGLALHRAVAASCAVPGIWPPIAIGGRRWIDGGIWSPANVHLAAGHRRVVALAPMVKAHGPGPDAAGQAGELRREGAEVALLTPDSAARRAFGRNPLDQSRRPAVARAGHAQAAAHVESVARVWGTLSHA
ncbi:patatin-like phospholipase family protein [Streptomyces sp. NPDC026206]|uniref:patatin-like phospholipase family protein n=1 Tax=Streptomyces sp. NPDC026206 TaxID=3157089 RepID=UPI0033E49E22